MNSFEYSGYKIYENTSGFVLGNGMFAIKSYAAAKDGEGYVFAFCVGTLQASIHGYQPDDLVPKARQVVRACLDSADNLVDREEYTFEYDNDSGTFHEVKNPTWWVKLSR